MKKIMSFSIDENLYQKMCLIVPTRKMSLFIRNVLNKELELKENDLIKSYKESELDSDRNELLLEWDSIDNV